MDSQADSKRPREVVDLTCDDNPPAKNPRLMSSSSGGLPSSFFKAAPSSTQYFHAIDLTQSDDDPVHLYGSLDTKIVGVRYYNGYANPGEHVICRREPSNPYDSNAIQVNNAYGDQIGHIPRTIAARLAVYMDQHGFILDGELTDEKGYYDCPMRIHIFGPADSTDREYLEHRLTKDRLIKAKGRRNYGGGLNQASPKVRRDLGFTNGRSVVGLGDMADKEMPGSSLLDLMRESQAVQVRSVGDFAQSLAMDEDQLSRMPMASQPARLQSQLLSHQLQGLAWMISKEKPEHAPPNSKDHFQLWKHDGQGRYLNLATNFATSKPPTLSSGGILADDMGLGKTLQVISLILEGGAGSTLIVAPVGVMSNWEQQIEQHVLEGHRPRVFIYHGAAKAASKLELSGFDVVITSYATLTNDHKSGKLFKMNWRRVVLDEGHIIRNARTRVAQVTCEVTAQSRWVLTGTPIVNHIRDLHSLLKFLRITGGIEQAELFNSIIGRPLVLGDAHAAALVQLLMRDLCLRRRKEMKFIDLKLPPKTEYVHRIAFWPDERKKYDALLSEAQGALEESQAKSAHHGQMGRYQVVLERLLRLRQTCNHWTLCRQRIDDLLKMIEEQGIVVGLTAENRALLQQVLRLVIESQDDCAVCIDTLRDPVITHCKHTFCRVCITKTIQAQHKCPLCRAELSEEHLVEPASEGGVDDEALAVDAETQSSKTEALLKIVQATLKNAGSKVIIFSQWTSFLTVIRRRIEAVGLSCCRVDGSMPVAERDTAIGALQSIPNTRVMLASLSVCSIGLNLVAADTVILADSWWAPAIEDQAVDRVHRLGQTRPTTVWRLVMEDSVEERVLDIQQEKRVLVSKAFMEKQGAKSKAKETRMADVMKLLS